MSIRVNLKKESEWRRRMEAYNDSRETIHSFCESKGVSVHQFYYWRRRLADIGKRYPKTQKRLA